MGAGRTELAMSLFGKAYGKHITGTMIKDGKELKLHNVSEAIDNGLAYLTEDRKTAGLVLIDDIKRNITISNLHSISERGVVNMNKEIHVAEDYRKKLRIKSSSILQKKRATSQVEISKKSVLLNGCLANRMFYSLMNLHEGLTLEQNMKYIQS